MKRLLFITLIPVLLLCLSGCGASPAEPETTAAPTTEAPAETTAAPTEPNEEAIVRQIEDLIWGRRPDGEAALALAQELADSGSADGIYYVGKILLDGLAGVEADNDKAIEYLLKGAEMDQTDCMVLLGFVYTYGTNGQAQDVDKGIAWMTKGAELGNATCMNNLGNYLTWNGDPAEGAKWLEMAVEDPNTPGRSLAYLNLGCAYGKLGDLEAAEKSFRESVSRGETEAFWYMGNMYRDAQEYDLAMQSYEEGVEAGNDTCLLGIGELYQYGMGVTKNLTTARDYYQQAQDAGNYRAQDYLNHLG